MKHYKFAWKKFSITWILLLVLSFLGMITISLFSEVDEIYPFGYELGFLLTPIFSSLIVSIPLIFWTSHLPTSIYEFQGFAKLEALRLTLKEIIELCHKETMSEKHIPTYNESDLHENYSINLNEDQLKKIIFIERYNRNFFLYEYLNITIGTSMLIVKSKEISNLEPSFFDLVKYYEAAREALINDNDYNSFLKNSIFIIEMMNKEISTNKAYKIYYDITFEKPWVESFLKKKVNN